MIFLVYSQIEALNTSHLIDTLVTDDIFICNVVVETLHWEINGFSLGGFVNIEVGLVRISERSQLNYSAFLLYTFNHVTYNQNNLSLSYKNITQIFNNFLSFIVLKQYWY